MDLTRQDQGGGGHSPHGVFNPPAPLWGEGVLDNVKTLVLKTSRQGCAAYAVSHRHWLPILS